MKTIRLTTSNFLAALVAIVLVAQPISMRAGETPLPAPAPESLLRQMSGELSTAWGYIGIHDVEGTAAHHIAIVGEEADLQIWIREEGRPLPLKIVATYKNDPMAPQFQAVIRPTRWSPHRSVRPCRRCPRTPGSQPSAESITTRTQEPITRSSIAVARLCTRWQRIQRLD